ncbi:MAG: helix-turn-helix transcriptional regulator [Bdellovibrionales bacterium]|nr:helix-turn-helix transcriptional regulator [Bdellovibrionales bacterium]
MREAARRIGVPESTYREWEYGRKIRGEPYLQIAKTFGVSIEELLGQPERQLTTIEDRLNRAIEDLKFLQSECKRHKK